MYLNTLRNSLVKFSAANGALDTCYGIYTIPCNDAMSLDGEISRALGGG